MLLIINSLHARRQQQTKQVGPKSFEKSTSPLLTTENALVRFMYKLFLYFSKFMWSH